MALALGPDYLCQLVFYLRVRQSASHFTCCSRRNLGRNLKPLAATAAFCRGGSRKTRDRIIATRLVEGRKAAAMAHREHGMAHVLQFPLRVQDATSASPSEKPSAAAPSGVRPAWPRSAHAERSCEKPTDALRRRLSDDRAGGVFQPTDRVVRRARGFASSAHPTGMALV